MVRLYTTGCPRCIVLEKKLEQSGTEFEKVNDFDVNLLLDKGFEAAPVLEVDNEYKNFNEAIKWINNN